MARNDPFGRLLLAIAGSSATFDDLRRFVKWIRSQNPDDFVEDVMRLRDLVSAARLDYGRPHSSRPSVNEVGSRIERVLTEQAGLTKAEAAAEIEQELQRRHANETFPSFNKRSFSAWISRLLEDVPESELLHIATLITRRYARGGTGPDWPLKTNDR